jgi:hypothetical protein
MTGLGQNMNFGVLDKPQQPFNTGASFNVKVPLNAMNMDFGSKESSPNFVMPPSSLILG